MRHSARRRDWVHLVFSEALCGHWNPTPFLARIIGVTVSVNLQLPFGRNLKVAVGFEPSRIFAVNQKVFVRVANRLAILSRVPLLPDNARDERLFAEDFIAKIAKAVYFAVVDTDNDYSGVRQQFVKQLESWPHHAEPLVVAFEVFLVHGVGRVLEPLAHEWAADVVVVAPAFVPGVVRRVDVDAVHLARVHRQQRLQSVQVVAVNDEIVVERRLLPLGRQRLLRIHDQLAKRHRQMMRVNERLPFELQRWHSTPFPNESFRRRIFSWRRTSTDGPDHGTNCNVKRRDSPTP